MIHFQEPQLQKEQVRAFLLRSLEGCHHTHTHTEALYKETLRENSNHSMSNIKEILTESR